LRHITVWKLSADFAGYQRMRNKAQKNMPLKCPRLNDLKRALWIVRGNYKAGVQTLDKPKTYKIAIYKANRRKEMEKLDRRSKVGKLCL
jgi:hypothetical protein